MLFQKRHVHTKIRYQRFYFLELLKLMIFLPRQGELSQFWLSCLVFYGFLN